MLHNQYAIISEGVRVLFLLVAPVIAAVTLTSLLVGSLQAATTIYDLAIGYAARVSAAALVVYIFFPSFSRALVSLAELAFK